MNVKLLVGLGVAGVLAVGACFGGVMVTKGAAHDRLRETSYKIEEMFRKVGKPVDIRSTGIESTGLFSDVSSYEISFADGDGFSLPLKIISSYGIGTVENTFDLGDSFYSRYKVDGKNSAALKSLLSGLRAKYSFFSDSVVTTVDFKPGSMEFGDVNVNWKAGNGEIQTVNVSKRPYAKKGLLDINEFTVTDKSSNPVFRIAGIKLDSGASGDNSYSAVFSVNEYFSNFGGNDVRIDKFQLSGNYSGGKGHSKFIINTGMEASAGNVKIDSKDEDSHIDVKDTKFKVAFNEFDFTEIAKKCESKSIEELSEQMQSCMSSVDPREGYRLAFSFFNKGSSVEANLNSVLNGAKVDLRNKIYLDAGVNVDTSNPMVFISSILLNGMYHIDSSLLSMPEYKLEKFSNVLKSYARDPDAETLEYHLEYRKGILSVNGRKLDF